MTDTNKSELRRRLDEIQSRVRARHYREFDLKLQGREQVVERMIDDLVDHLGQRNENGRVKNTTGVIVAESEKEAKAITQSVRQKLKAQGILKGNQVQQLAVLKNQNWKDRDKSKPEQYEQAGKLIVQFNQQVGDYAKGELVHLTGYFRQQGQEDRRLVMTENQEGKERPLPIERPVTFDLYKRDVREVMVGEQLRATRAGQSLSWDKAMIHNMPRDQRDLHDYAQGEQFRISGIAPDGYLKTGFREISNKFYHLEYGYAATPEQLPVREVDKVLVHGEQSLRHPRVQAMMEQQRDNIQVYREQERAPAKDQGFERELTPDT